MKFLQAFTLVAFTDAVMKRADTQAVGEGVARVEATAQMRQYALTTSSQRKAASTLNARAVMDEVERLAALSGEELGMQAGLNNAGYLAVARARGKQAMDVYIRRVLDSMDLEFKDNKTYTGILPYYDGECSVQSFEALTDELLAARYPHGCKGAWVIQKGADKVKKQKVHEEPVVASSENDGAHATLDKAGYRQVASLNSNKEMGIFIKRILKRENLEVKDDAGLNGMIPYFSGVCSKNGYNALVNELRCAAGQIYKATMKYDLPKDRTMPAMAKLKTTIATLAGVSESQIKIGGKFVQEAQGLARFENCFEEGKELAEMDAKCSGSLKCAQNGLDNRDYGDCDGAYCCSQPRVSEPAEAISTAEKSQPAPASKKPAYVVDVKKHEQEDDSMSITVTTTDASAINTLAQIVDQALETLQDADVSEQHRSTVTELAEERASHSCGSGWVQAWKGDVKKDE